jgi:vitamin B12 transporter
MKLLKLFVPLRHAGLYRYLHLIAVLIITATGHCFALMAQVPPLRTDTTKPRQLSEVQVWSGTFQTSTSPTPVQVIKGAALERVSSLSVADALRFFTSAQLKDYGGVGGLKTVDVRSLGSSQVAVFYDGIQLNNAQNGQVDLGKYSLDNIDGITLYAAQKSTILQPARGFASGSSIYLQSRQPAFSDSLNRYQAAMRTGSMGLVNPSVFWQHRLSKKTFGTISTEWTQANGRYPFRYTNGIYDTVATRNNGNMEALRFEAGLNSRLTDSSTLNIKAYLFNSARGLPGAIVANKFNYQQREWDRNAFIQSAYQLKGKRYSLHAHAKYANDYLRYLDPEMVTTTGYSDNRYHLQELYASVVNGYKITHYLSLALAADYMRNTMQSDIYRFSYPARNTWLTALAVQLQMANLDLQANLLSTISNETTRLYESASAYRKLTPALLVSWQPLGNSSLSMRGFYKALYRLPTFNELYYTQVGSANLQPEYSRQYNLGLGYQVFIQGAVLKHINLQADAYHNQVTNKIIAVPGQNLRRWIMDNVGEVNIKGIETRLQAGWHIAQSILLNTGINYTYQDALDVTAGSSGKNQIPYTPRHSGSVTAGLLWRQLNINYSYIYTGERYNQKANIPANYVDPWYTHDASVIWQTHYHSRQLKAGIDVNNLFNQYYDVVANFPMPGRYYRFKLSFSY